MPGAFCMAGLAGVGCRGGTCSSSGVGPDAFKFCLLGPSYPAKDPFAPQGNSFM